MNELVSTLPFEIYELHLFHLVAKHGSFTRAAEKAHLTQSAITRQIQGMEGRLGTALFERNTRNIRLTPAGEVLFARSSALLKQVEETMQAIEDSKQGGGRTLRVGVCRSIGLSYLPGFFVGFRRKYPEVSLRLETDSSLRIVAKMVDGELEAGVIHSLPALPRQVTCAHKISDDFTFILPSTTASKDGVSNVDSIHEALASMPVLLPQPNSQARDLIDSWLTRQKIRVVPAMELDNFDLIVNLVALGMGCSITPHRALPLYLQRGQIRRLQLKPPLSRTLMIIVRKSSLGSGWVQKFVDEVLF